MKPTDEWEESGGFYAVVKLHDVRVAADRLFIDHGRARWRAGVELAPELQLRGAEIEAGAMTMLFKAAIPVLPAANTAASLAWWVAVCGFTESFRDGTPPRYAGIERDGAQVHLAEMDDSKLARVVGDQTMVRFAVGDVAALYAEYQERGGTVHPNGGLQTKPWGTKEFAAIDPNGVCVAFYESAD